MERHEVNNNPFVGCLEPLAAFSSGSQRGVRDIAELGHCLAEIFMEVRTEIIHDVVDNRIRGVHSNMG